MAWIGWQEGMSGPVVAAAKAQLKRRFSYAKLLDAGELFTPLLAMVLSEFQIRKNVDGYSPPLRVDGVLDFATQKALGLIEVPKNTRPPRTLFTVAGTGVDHWTGYPADVGRAVQDCWYWQPIGYPAAAFPMNKSVAVGRAELVKQIAARPVTEPKALAGYSQGAIVISEVWKHDILNPRGVLHEHLPSIKAAVTWGNPMRELGIAFGNVVEGTPVPTGRGIAGDRLVDTPSWWWDFAHRGDIYTDTPNDDAGEHMEMIFNIVFSRWTGSNSALEQVLEIVQNPTVEILAAVRAIAYGALFFGKGTGPHINYRIDGAIDHLRETAAQLAVNAA